MKQLGLLALSLLIFSNVFAAQAPPVVNKVSYRFTADQWVSTDTAKVTVSVNATLSASGMATIHQQVMQNLAKISSKAEWHITLFNRSQDKSGLESVYVEAQTRLPESALATLRDAAKAVSHAGETYRLVSIAFTPSMGQMEKTRTALRANIYAQVKTELATLNQLYPQQKYFVHSISFNENLVPMPRVRTMMLAKAASTAAPSMQVSNKLVESAQVVLASIAE